MEDILEQICSIYLIDKKAEDTESKSECKRCKKKIKSEKNIEAITNKPVESAKKTLSDYLYQSSNTICLPKPSLYSCSNKVPNYYMKE